MIDFSFLESDTERVEFIQNLGKLIIGGEIPPEKVNEGLANYFSINRFLISIHEQVNLENEQTKTDYKIWYSEKFIEQKAKLCEGLTAKSKAISQAEIESSVIVHYKDDYKKWQEKLLMADRRDSFYYRLLDSWSTQSKILINLSQNMRSEMLALSVENRANKDVTKEGLIRHVKKIKIENTDDGDSN